MCLVSKRGFKDCPGFLNSTGRLGPKEGGNATSTLHSRGSPNKTGQIQQSKPPIGVTMMPLVAPSISKYWSLVRPHAQIVALCLRLPQKATGEARVQKDARRVPGALTFPHCNR